MGWQVRRQNWVARLDRLPVSRFHLTVLVVAALSLFFDTLDTVVTGFAFAAFRTDWQLGARALGITSAIGLAGYLAGSVIVGFVADRFGRKAVMTWSLLLYSVFSASRALSGGIGMFATLNFFTWLFVGMESCVVPPYLAELWPSRLRGRFQGCMMGFFAFGVALSPVWALVFLPNVGWRWTLALTAPFALLAGAMRTVLPESPRWLLSQGRVTEAENVVAGIERSVVRSSGRPAAADRAGGGAGAGAPGHKGRHGGTRGACGDADGVARLVHRIRGALYFPDRACRPCWHRTGSRSCDPPSSPL